MRWLRGHRRLCRWASRSSGLAFTRSITSGPSRCTSPWQGATVAGGSGGQFYVGKAIPPGTEGRCRPGADPGPALFKRLAEHSRSIEQATNLDLADFFCRYLVVEDIWIPLGESLMIEKFSPVWNMVLDGFGSHDVGGGRYKQEQSAWDLIHPGRDWANRCTPSRRTTDTVAQAVARLHRKHRENRLTSRREGGRTVFGPVARCSGLSPRTGAARLACGCAGAMAGSAGRCACPGRPLLAGRMVAGVRGLRGGIP